MSLWLKLAIIIWISTAVISVRYVFGDVQSFGEQQYLEYITTYLSYFSLAHLVVLFLLPKKGIITAYAKMHIYRAVAGVFWRSPQLATSNWASGGLGCCCCGAGHWQLL